MVGILGHILIMTYVREITSEDLSIEFEGFIAIAREIQIWIDLDHFYLLIV